MSETLNTNPPRSREDKTERNPEPLWRYIVTKFIEAVGLCGLGFYAYQASEANCLTRQSLKENADSFTRTFGEMQKQTSSISDSATATKSAAETSAKALRINQDFFRVEQRPYVVIAPSFVTDSAPAVGRTIRANGLMKNIGKSPAISCATYARLIRTSVRTVEEWNIVKATLFTALRRELNRDRERSASPRRDLVPEDKPMFFTVELEGGPLTVPELKTVEANAIHLLFMALTPYRDRFGHLHETESCWLYSGNDIATWEQCSTHNAVH